MRKLAFTALPLLCLCLAAVSPASAAAPLKLGVHPYLSATEIARRFKPLDESLPVFLATRHDACGDNLLGKFLLQHPNIMLDFVNVMFGNQVNVSHAEQNPANQGYDLRRMRICR